MKIWRFIAFLAWISAASYCIAEEKSLWKHLGSQDSSSESSTPVVGVRGLEKSRAGKQTNARDFAALERLEKLEVKPEEIDTFLKEGRLK